MVKRRFLFRYLLILLVIIVPSSLWAAYDFTDTNNYGHVFYYRILNEDHAVALTYPGSDINHPYQLDAYTHYPLPSGNVVISSLVLYQGEEYHLESIDPCTFQDCHYITSAYIPDGVQAIDFAVFSGCQRLQSVRLPATLTTLGSYAFRNCTSLQSIVIPDAVASVANNAFDGCSSLRHVTLGMNIENVQTEAFMGCGAIDTLVVRAHQPPLAPSTLFSDPVLGQCVLMIPCRTLGDYQSVSPWSLFSVIHEADTCWAHVAVQTNDSALGLVLGDGVHNRYASVSLYAVPARGHCLQTWSTGSHDNPLIITLTSDTLITATFAPYSPDTLTRIDTVFTPIIDTVYVNNKDTVYLLVTDTVYANYTDTVYLSVTDTVYANYIDTVYLSIPDTNYAINTDTVYLMVVDTMLLVGIDTLIIHDTLIMPVFWDDPSVDTVWITLHDTLVYSDTIFSHSIDTVAVPMWVHDTLVEYSVVHDTVLRFFWVHDTLTHHDTLWAYNTLRDTLFVVHFDTLWRTELQIEDHYYYDTVFLFDTLVQFVYDTVIQQVVVFDTIVSDRYVYLTDTLQIVRYDTIYALDTLYIDRWCHDTVTIVGYNNPPYIITAATLDPDKGLAIGSGHFYGESLVEIGAVPMRGYLFSHWDDGNVENPRQVLLTSDTFFLAHFVADPGVGNESEKYRIGIDRDQIVVYGALGKTVTIYDAVGRRIHSAESNSHQYRVAVADTGMYVVQIGSAVGQRVIVVGR